MDRISDPAQLYDPEGMTLVQMGESHRDALVMTQLLTEVTGLEVVDAEAVLGRHTGSIVIRDMRCDLAGQLAERMARASMPVLSVPADQMISPHRTGTVTHLQYDANAIDVVLPGDGEHTRVAWEDVLLLSAGWVENSIEDAQARDRLASADLCVRLGSMNSPFSSSTNSPVLLCDVYFRDGRDSGDTCFRLDAHHTSYAHLEERKKPGATENFRTVVCDLVAGAVRARLNHGAALLTEGRMPAHSRHRPEAFLEDSLGLLLLARYAPNT